VSMAVAADPVSPQEFEAMRANPSPTAQWTTVMAWYQAGRIATSDQLNALVTETWSFARSPARDAGMSVSELVQMFRTAGFITNREHTDGCLRHGAVGRGGGTGWIGDDEGNSKPCDHCDAHETNEC